MDAMVICGVLMQVYEKIEMHTVQSIESKWAVDTCLAMFMYGNMTYQGYQTIINLVSKDFCSEDGTFKDRFCEYRTRQPLLCNP